MQVAKDMGFNSSKIEDLCRQAAGRGYGKAASVSVVVAQLAVSIASVVFTTDFLDFAFCQRGVSGLCHHKRVYLLASFGVSLLILLVENLAVFAYVSLAAIVCICSALLAIDCSALALLLDPVRPQPVVKLADAAGFASFIGISLFSMEVAAAHHRRASAWSFPSARPCRTCEVSAACTP